METAVTAVSGLSFYFSAVVVAAMVDLDSATAAVETDADAILSGLSSFFAAVAVATASAKAGILQLPNIQANVILSYGKMNICSLWHFV